MRSVIFKPDLRVDAAHRLVEGLLREELGDRLGAPLPVKVSLGGPRGMRVTVTVPDDQAAEVQRLLSGHLFETVALVRPVPAADAPA